ncbi:MAG: 16S rRNA (guanine(527)-N(7))-methyltransferase RsmG [Chitinispirillales bacterium]|nr:16S rRNA (guanine(527)-N(7))-methyltransferase RsmG [Chitinispirillales bacterium]
MEIFERYHAWLVSENANVNLISRRTESGDIWTVHFLDSLLPIKHMDFSGHSVLDFGTGGGLPGIPIAIMFGDAEVTLLDSKKKKIAAVRGAAEHLGLKNCRFCDNRIEEAAGAQFDLIVSRSVKIEPAYKPILLNLLKPQGKIILYKSKILDDVRQFGNYEIFDASTRELGERKIVVVTK